MIAPAAANSRAPGSSGTAAASITTVISLRSAISAAWPSRPKPVTSVIACTPAARAMCATWRLSRSIDSTAASKPGSWPSSRCLAAVSSTPVPTGLVSSSASPGRAPPVRMIAAGWITPVTESPYFGSSSITV